MKRTTTLHRFLLCCASDPGQLANLLENPEKMLHNVRLSADELKVLKNGDLQKLRILMARNTISRDSHISKRQKMNNRMRRRQAVTYPRSFWKIMKPPVSHGYKGLTVVGTGIRAGLQTTPEARVCIERAKKVLYLVSDPITEAWLLRINPAAESLRRFYQECNPRLHSYEAIMKRILACLRQAGDVCVVFYGHPGVFVLPAHESMRRARRQGFKARMLPAISADANLFADLGVDPGMVGMQSYDVTSFLINKYRFDSSAGLLLWQIGALGEIRWMPGQKVGKEKLRFLAGHLSKHYGPRHRVAFYQAAEFPLAHAKVKELSISDLPRTEIPPTSILYVPPKRIPQPDQNIIRVLGIKSSLRNKKT